MPESITLTREFPAPREVVWNATTTPENFATWFGTEYVDVPLETLDFSGVVGDTWSGVMHLPDGSEKGWVGEFVEVDAPNRFVLTLTDVPEQPETATPLTLDYSDTETGTLLTLTQVTPGFTDDDHVMLAAGYEAFFDTMTQLVEQAPR